MNLCDTRTGSAFLEPDHSAPRNTYRSSSEGTFLIDKPFNQHHSSTDPGLGAPELVARSRSENLLSIRQGSGFSSRFGWIDRGRGMGIVGRCDVTTVLFDGAVVE